MQTASFFTVPITGGRISIARLAPRRHPAGYRIYSQLAPGPWFNSVDETQYRRLFAEHLVARDPEVCWNALHELAAPFEPILLCWEQPGVFCHRRLVATWFEEALGVIVPELVPEPAGMDVPTLDLFGREDLRKGETVPQFR